MSLVDSTKSDNSLFQNSMVGCRYNSVQYVTVLLYAVWQQQQQNMVQNMMSCNMRYVFTAQKCTFVEI